MKDMDAKNQAPAPSPCGHAWRMLNMRGTRWAGAKQKTRLANNEAGWGASVFSSILELGGSSARNLDQIGAGPQYSYALSNAIAPSTAKIAADTRCTARTGTRCVSFSPSQTAGALASIMPSVVPATTQASAAS